MAELEVRFDDRAQQDVRSRQPQPGLNLPFLPGYSPALNVSARRLFHVRGESRRRTENIPSVVALSDVRFNEDGVDGSQDDGTISRPPADPGETIETVEYSDGDGLNRPDPRAGRGLRLRQSGTDPAEWADAVGWGRASSTCTT